MTFATVKVTTLACIIEFNHNNSLFVCVCIYIYITNFHVMYIKLQGAGHTAPEYKREECLAMLSRWISNNPL